MSTPGEFAARRLSARLLRHRTAASVVLLVLTGWSAIYASRVRPDYSIEMAFPRFDQSRLDYERFRKEFPFDDATALVVVQAQDLFTLAGLRRLAALETDLGRVGGVVDTQGLTSVRDLVADADTIQADLLVPEGNLTPDDLAHIKRVATTEPMFAWNVASPDGRATTIRVTLSQDYASSDAMRTRFMVEARQVLARHEAAARRDGVDQRLTLSGLPVIRSEFTELINADVARLFPTALGIVVLLLYLSFRSVKAVAAAVITIAVATVWTMGVMGAAGLPLQVLTQIAPIVVMIVSISDTSHIVTEFMADVRRGTDPHSALAAAVGESALPCLMTEVAIASGFAGLAFNDMIMIQQFGVATAAGAMLAWVANMTALPLALSWLGAGRTVAAAPASSALLEGAVRAVEYAVSRHPRRVATVATLVLALATVFATRVGREYFSYDDLRPSGELYRDLRHVEDTFGGTVPLALFVEPAEGRPREPNAMLEPEALSLLARLTDRLRGAHEDDIRNVTSLSDYLGKAHRLFTAGDLSQGPLPPTRRLAAQELSTLDDPRVLRNIVSADRSTAAVFAMVPDKGSSHASSLIGALRQYLDQEEEAHPYRVTITGIYGIADGIYRSLVGGLAASLGWALLISLTVFALVLRSFKLAAIALVPNVLPLLLLLGVMGALQVDLKPTTVVIFSIVLVIADDDTIQYLTRFRLHYIAQVRAGASDPHRAAALATLRQVGPPMLVTGLSVAIGFSTLLFSEFLGLANLGLLLGLSLIAAFLTDLFLSPLLLTTLRPRIAVPPEAA